MKFAFCGQLDAPDWLLQEIALLSRVSSVRMKLLCAQVVDNLLGDELDFDKVAKMTKDAGLQLSDVKATLAALRFVIQCGAKYDVADETLINELQQIGLPKEHAESLTRPYRANFEALRLKFASETLRLPRVESVDYRVNYALGSSLVARMQQPSVQLRLSVDDGRSVAVEIDAAKFHVLHAELQHANALMQSL